MTTEPVNTFYDRVYLRVILCFAVATPLVYYGMLKSAESNNNNVRQWLPNDAATQTYKRFYDSFGTDEFALVSWDGCTLNDPRLEKFVALIDDHVDEDGQKLFGNVNSGVRLLDKLTGKPFHLKRDVAIERLKGIAIGHDGKLTCAIVQMTEAGDRDRRHSVAELRKLATGGAGVESETIHMTGDAVTNAAVDETSAEAINTLLWLAGLVAAGFAFLGLRDVRLILIVFVTAGYSAGLSEAVMGLLGGQMNLILTVMPVLVFVLSLSAGVHIVNYYRDAIDESGLATAPLVSIQHGWLPCTMAAGTTAIGLGSLCVSDIVPVSDFGKYSAIGILLSLVVVFLLLPSLLVAKQRVDARLGWRASHRPSGESALNGLLQRGIQTFGAVITRNHLATLAVCLAILVLLGLGTRYTKTSVKPLRFFDEQHQLRRDYSWLQDDERFGPQIPIELVVKFDTKESALDTLGQMQMVGDLERELAESRSDLIGSTISAVTFAPSLEDVSHRRRFTTNERLAENREDYRKVRFYSNGVSGRGNREELWRLSARVRDVGKEYDAVIDEVKAHVTGFLQKRQEKYAADIAEANRGYKQKLAKAQRAYELGRVEHAGIPDALTQLEQKFEDYKFNIKKERDVKLDQLINDSLGVTIDYTGMIPLFYAAQNQLLSGLKTSFMLAFALIAVLMVLWFRSLSAGLMTMFPNIFPAAVIFGYMGWRGWYVDIGAMMTASVAMGIAVDDTVHYLTWFRRGLHQSLSRVEAIMYAYRRCALAMTQTTGIAGLGLLMFSLSSFQPVAQFGFLMFVLLAAALFGDLIFLPALLASPAGRLFLPRTRRVVVQPAEAPVAEPRTVA